MIWAVVASCMAWQDLAPLQSTYRRGAYRHEIPEISQFILWSWLSSRLDRCDFVPQQQKGTSTQVMLSKGGDTPLAFHSRF
jgi:hypothetical protein